VGLLVITSPFLPLLGAQGLSINYRCGDAEVRRRIGWIYIGPTIGFIAAGTFFFLMMFGAIVFAGSHGEPAQMFGIDVWRLLIVATFDFVPLVVGAFLLGLSFSIFYNGAVDPRLAIRRGAAIGFCGIVLSGLFVAFESLVQSQVEGSRWPSSGAGQNAMAAGARWRAIVFRGRCAAVVERAASVAADERYDGRCSELGLERARA
jgi:hypothetical protein